MIRLGKGSTINLAKTPQSELLDFSGKGLGRNPHSVFSRKKQKYEPTEEPEEIETVEADDDLVRVGQSDFFMSPNEAKDPNYEDPIAFDTPIGFETAIVLDHCNFGGQVNGVLLFFRLPSFQFVWRNPDCNKDVSPGIEIPVFVKPDIPINSCNVNDRAGGVPQVVVFQSDSYREFVGIDSYGNGVQSKYTKTTRIKQVNYLPSGEYSHYVVFEMNISFNYNEAYAEANQIEYPSPYQSINRVVTFGIKRYSPGFVQPIDGSQAVYNSAFDLGGVLTYSTHHYDYFATGTGNYSAEWFYNNLNFILRNYNDRNPSELIIEEVNCQFHVFCGDYAPIDVFPPLPPPKKMACCPDNTNLEILLKLILKKIGSSSLPATVPSSLTKRDSGTLKIQSLAEYIAYSVRQTNAQIGQFPQEIKIQDADLTQEGNQEKIIKLPNLAESIAEIIGILLTLQSESNANLIATVNSMIEAGSAKQAASLAVDYSRANSEYLAYKGKQVEHKLPFTFKPGESRLDKMLVSGEVSVKGFENDDKEDLNDALAPLLELAAMWKAANFKNLGTSDTLGKLKSILTGAVDISKAVDNLVKTPPPQDPNNPTSAPEPKKSDWDTFLEEAEQGFIAQPGITDTTNPYSRPLNQRPKIREIGNDTSDTSSSGQ